MSEKPQKITAKDLSFVDEKTRSLLDRASEKIKTIPFKDVPGVPMMWITTYVALGGNDEKYLKLGNFVLNDPQTIQDIHISLPLLQKLKEKYPKLFK